MINYNEAFELELIVRHAYGCRKGGVMGIADANHLERCPLDAALVVFAPLYKDVEEIEEIDQFIDKYVCYFTFSDYKYAEEKIKSYIEELRRLVNKYCR